MQSTHTQKEIDKFDQLANRFWDKDGPLKTLHQINPIRLDFITEFTTLNQIKAADIGCGGGILAESLAEQGALVDAIDLSSVGITAAKEQQQKSNSSVNYQLIDTETFADNHPEQFDLVTCMEMLEHVENPSLIIRDCAKMVKPGGFVIFSTLNKTLKAKLLAVYLAEYIIQMIPEGTHDPNYFIAPAKMRKIAENNGLKAISMIGFEFSILKQTFIRSQNTDINYIFAFKKPEVSHE